MKIYLISNVAFVMQLQTKSFIYLITNFGHKTPQIYKWTMLYKGTPPITKIDFFRALPEKGGAVCPSGPSMDGRARLDGRLGKIARLKPVFL